MYSKHNNPHVGIKILVICSKNSGQIAPFIAEQVDALIALGLECDFFTIQGKGVMGYLRNRHYFLEKIRSFKPDIIHAHYGLSGLLANTQRKIPVVTTYHGSDINLNSIFKLSRLNMFLSAFSIFVSQKNLEKSKLKSDFALIPCGIDTTLSSPMDKLEARKHFGINPEDKVVLFAGAFSNKVKNGELAQKAVEMLPNVSILELTGYNRNEVAILINAVDVCLMTSLTEGSPQFIKEAMACNCPIVSVPVGDVAEIIKDVDGCFLSSYEINDLSTKINSALNYSKRSDGRNRIITLELDTKMVAEKINNIYITLIKKAKD